MRVDCSARECGEGGWRFAARPERVPPPHLWPDQLSRTPINRVHQVPAEAARQRASAKAATLAPDLERRVRREALSSI